MEARTTDRFKTELSGCPKNRSGGGFFTGDADSQEGQEGWAGIVDFGTWVLWASAAYALGQGPGMDASWV